MNTEAASLAMARLSGCDCEPDITVELGADGTQHAYVSHDGWCRLLAVVERRN